MDYTAGKGVSQSFDNIPRLVGYLIPYPPFVSVVIRYESSHVRLQRQC